MRKLFLGLVVGATALGASAFTNVRSAGSVYAQTTTGNYTLISNYNAARCLTVAQLPCSYTVTTLGAANNVEANAPFTTAEINMYVSAGYLTANSTALRIYVPAP